MKKFNVWSEGYRCTGGYGTAYFHGSVFANSFKEACEKIFEKEQTYNKEKNTLWGCKLFDNESDARKNFGWNIRRIKNGK